MNGWGIAANLTNLVSRLPIERLFARNGSKDLEAFEQRLKEKGLLVPTTKSPQHSSEQGLRAKGLLSPTGARVTQTSSPAESPARNASDGVCGSMEPTTEETVMELRRRLGKELYRMEMDLASGARIAGKPCDCLDAKHTLELEGTAEELMSYGYDPVYGEIIAWLRGHQAEFRPEEITRRPPQHYRGLAPEVRGFRKGVMGKSKSPLYGNCFRHSR